MTWSVVGAERRQLPDVGEGLTEAEIARQPVFIVAVVGCALGYGVMNLLMAATPIAMSQCAHPFSSAALVLEWHVLGMFVPSFFTGSLIRRFGVLPVMAVGVLLNGLCIAVALAGVAQAQSRGAEPGAIFTCTDTDLPSGARST